MADGSSGATAILETSSLIPIAELSPLLESPASRSIKAVVSLTWPYSSVTGAVAFLLAEPDFRLRRSRGQVRVQFSGSSAKAVEQSGVASGDEVLLCLDGVEWLTSQTTVSTPGRGVEFDLRFKERLLLQVRQEDSDNVILINIDHPATEPELENGTHARTPSPEATSPSQAAATSSLIEPSTDEAAKSKNEWLSPAFIKRARTSYGSLFDAEYDPFAEEDGTIRGKGRKRARLSSTWSYNSRSPSPENRDFAENPPNQSSGGSPLPSKPVMLDEGCQTFGFETSNATEALTDFSRQDIHLGNNLTTETNVVDLQIQRNVGRETITEQPEAVLSEVLRLPESVISPELVREQADAYLVSSSRPLAYNRESIVSPPPLGLADFTAFPPEIENSYVHEQHGIVKRVPTVLVQEPGEPATPGEHDDLYSASPVRRYSDLSSLRFDTAEQLTSQGPSVEFAPLEDQYGNWQAEHSYTSHTASPRGNTVSSTRYEAYSDHSDDVGNRHDPPTEFSGPRVLTNYAEVDKVSVQHIDEPWDRSVTNINYPDLPSPSEWQEAEVSAQKPPFGDSAVSRSQSAQPAVVDLTESDADEDEQAYSNEGIDQMDQVSVEAESFEDETMDQHWNTHHDDDISESSRSKDDLSHAGFENGDREFNHSRTDSGQAYASGDDDDEAESYDTDMETNNESANSPAPRAQQPPVVIDLLSSDDGDDGEYEISEPKFSHVSRTGLDAEHSDTEASNASADSVGTRGSPKVPYTGLSEIRMESSRHSASRILPRGEDDEEYEEDHEIEHEDDDESLPVAANLSSPASDRSAISHITNGVGEIGAPLEENGDAEHRASFSADIADGQTYHVESKNSPIHQYLMPSRLENMPQQTLRRPSLYDSQFSLDGANDERNGNILYPSLPREGVLKSPLPALNAAQHSQETIMENPMPQATRQLPTPDMTQITEHLLVDSQSTSHSIETSSPAESLKMPSQEVRVDRASEERKKTVHEDVGRRLGSSDVSKEDTGSIANDISTFAKAQTEPMSENVKSAHGDGEEGNATYGGILVSETAHKSQKAIEKPRINADKLHAHATEMAVIRDPESLQDVSDTHSLEKDLSETPDNVIPPTDPKLMDVSKAVLHTAGHEDSSELRGNHDASSKEKPEVNKGDDELEIGKGDVNGNSSNVIANLDGADGEKITTSPIVASVMSTAENNGVERQQPAAPLQKVLANTPRRSQRIVKSTSTVEVHIPARQITPTRPDAEQSASDREVEIPLILDSQATPEGHDASIELALDSLGSPSKQPREVRNLPVLDIKLRLSRCLRNDLRQFTSLKVLRYHLGKRLDILAIATTTPPEAERAKSGPRHYNVTFNITDPSIAPSGVSQVQVFRPYKTAIPIVKAGDGILLHSFEVISVKNKGFGLRSDDPSSWAVFKGDGEVETRGPPIELEGGEARYVNDMKVWYRGLDTTSLAKLQRANASKETAGIAGKGIGRVL